MASVLANLAASLRRNEILLPRLARFLARPGVDRDAVVREDARQTIKCFTERLAEYKRRNDPTLKDYFHPSRLGSCLRQQWYDRMKTPEASLRRKSGADYLREHLVFETGTYLGVAVQNLCEQAGFLTAREVLVRDDNLRLIGHADGDLMIDGHKYLLELKTSNTRNFSLLRDKPKEDHLLQMHAYMKPMKRSQGLIVYFDKDQGRAKEFLVKFDPDYHARRVVGRIVTLTKALKTGVPPEREGESPTQFPCSYCPFTRTCFPGNSLIFGAAKKVPTVKSTGVRLLKTKAAALKAQYPTNLPFKLRL